MNITFPRGDSYVRGFVLKDSRTGEPITDAFEEVYFTVKKLWSSTEYQLQKRMSTGGIVSDGDGHYTLFISPEDTNEMKFGDYDCDLEFVKPGYKKTFCGRLKLDKEVTHQSNE